jgi:hypothetical protein
VGEPHGFSRVEDVRYESDDIVEHLKTHDE